MTVRLHRRFQKQFGRLPKKLQRKVMERFEIFRIDPYDPELRNHSLIGEYYGYRSIDITGDVRAFYDIPEPGVVLFTHVGTHSQLYGK